MFITQIKTDKKKLNDIYSMHQQLWKGFVGRQNRDFLFRVEYQRRQCKIILVQSVNKPQWDCIFSPSEYMVKSYDPVFNTSNSFHFLINLSATVSKSNGPGRQPTRIPIPWNQYEQWFCDKGKNNGFDVITVSRIGDLYVSSRKKKELSIAGQKLTGVLKVTDPEIFHDAYRKGIGRGKAFGFGMLSLKRI